MWEISVNEISIDTFTVCYKHKMERRYEYLESSVSYTLRSIMLMKIQERLSSEQYFIRKLEIIICHENITK